MKMILLTAALFGLSACATSQVPMARTIPTPSDRLLAYQNQDDKNVSEVIVIRDRGIAASSCYYAVVIDNVVAARMDASERTSFRVEPGVRKLQVIRDPKGKGLCGVGDDHVGKTITLLPNEIQKYRLTLDLSGQPSLNPYVE